MRLDEKLNQALANHKHRSALDPVNRAAARGSISEDEYRALLRLRSDLEIYYSRADGRTVDWDRAAMFAVGGSGRHRSSKRVAGSTSGPMHIVDAADDLGRAYVAVGPLGFHILRAVAFLGVTVTGVAELLNVHRDVVAFRFREAVEALVEHYNADSRD